MAISTYCTTGDSKLRSDREEEFKQMNAVRIVSFALPFDGWSSSRCVQLPMGLICTIIRDSCINVCYCAMTAVNKYHSIVSWGVPGNKEPIISRLWCIFCAYISFKMFIVCTMLASRSVLLASVLLNHEALMIFLLNGRVYSSELIWILWRMLWMIFCQRNVWW